MAGANQDAKKQRDAPGATFNFEGFMDQIFTTVEANSSDVGTKPNEIIESTLNVVAKEKLESRLNTFYRLIGLPATRLEEVISDRFMEDLTEQELKNKLSQQGTLNYFSNLISLQSIETISGAALITSDEALTTGQEQLFFLQRELLQQGFPPESSVITGAEFSRRENDAKRLSAPPKTTEDIINMIRDPLPISDSIEENPSGRRISIFPIGVDAATPIVPLKKRVAPLFHDGDFVLSGASAFRLPRPFLESVIYLRTQRFTEDVADTVGDLLRNLDALVLGGIEDQELAQELINALNIPEISAAGDASSINTSLVEIQIVNKFVQAIKKSAESYREVINKIVFATEEIEFRPEPKDSPKEKAGNSTVVVEGSKKGIVDKRIADLELEEERLNAMEAILPTARVQQADTAFRITNCDDVGRNITRDIFVSEFTSVLSFNRESIQQRKREVEMERKRIFNQSEILKKQVQYFSGEFTGLSIFDVLCIFLALFTIDLNDVVALLNQDARNRLESSRFYSFQSDPSDQGIAKGALFGTDERTELIQQGLSQPVSEALLALETSVKDNFRLAEAFFTEAGKAGQNRG